MSQAAALTAWISLSPFLFLFPTRHHSCGPQVSLHSLVNILSLPLACGHLPDSNCSLFMVNFDQDSNIQQLSLCILSDMVPVSVTQSLNFSSLPPIQCPSAGEIIRMSGRFSRSSFWICH